MGPGHLIVIVVLGDHRQTQVYCGCGDQGIEKFYRFLKAGFPAICNQSSPGSHYRLADLYRLSPFRKPEGISTARPGCCIRSGQDSQFELTDRYNGYGHSGRKLAEWPIHLSGDKNRGIEQPDGQIAHTSSMVWPATVSSSAVNAGSAARSCSSRRKNSPCSHWER